MSEVSFARRLDDGAPASVVDALGRASIEEMTADGDWLVVLVPLTPHQYLRRTPELRGLKVPSTHSTLVQFQEQAGDISGRAVVVVMFERGGAQLVKMKRTS